MRTLSLILAAAAIAAVNAAGIKHDDNGNIVVEPSDGTTVFMDASVEGGKTSIQQISAQFKTADAARATLSQSVTDQLAAAKSATDATVEDLRNSAAAQAAAVEESLASTTATLNAALTSAVQESKTYADNKINSVVTPAVNKIAQDLTALEVKIKKDIDDDIKVELEKFNKVLEGTDKNLPAANCAAVKAARPHAADGAAWIKNGNTIVQVWCVDGKSLGGSGETQAEAASDCFSNPLVSAYNPKDGSKFIDPDADANDTSNAKKKNCPGNGLAKETSAKTCKEIKKNFKSAKNGVYWIHGRNDDFKSAPFQAYCWLADRDGGGWTLFLRSYYRDHHQPRFSNGNGAGSTGDVNDDVLGSMPQNRYTFEAYKLDDKYIRAVIGQSNPTNGARTSSGRNMFSYMVDQSGWNNYYSGGNYEYGIMKKYTARWRFVRFQQMDSSSTAEEFTSYKIPSFNGQTPVGDGTWNWKGRPRCGRNYVGSGGGAGISCNGQHNGNPSRSPEGGRRCRSNTGHNRWHGGFHLYMLNTNHDTYFYCCNGPQHSSYRRFAHRWYIRTHDGDTVA